MGLWVRVKIVGFGWIWERLAGRLAQIDLT